MLTSPSGAPIITRAMLVFFAILFTYPLWARYVGLYEYLGIEIAIFALYALGFNLLLGYTGLPSFGHGAYFGIGAYAYSMAGVNISDNPVLGLLFGLIAGAVSAGLVALFLSHRRGIYFALMTIAFGQVFWFLSIKLRWLTGGEDGFLNVLRPVIDLGFVRLDYGSNTTVYYTAAVLLAIMVIVLWRVVHSPFGTALQAIRMNETRARSAGYDVWLVKWTVFTLSGAVAGLAGGLLALTQESAYPNVMSLHASGFVVMMTLLGGGFVSFWGPIVGAIMFILARDVLGAASEAWLLWYGLLFIVVMLFEPEGAVGAWRRLVKLFTRTPRRPAESKVLP